MANFAKLVITLNSTSDLAAVMRFQFDHTTYGTFQNEWEIFTSRAFFGQIEKSNIDKYDQTEKFFTAISADISNSGPEFQELNVTKSSQTEITIEATTYGWSFTQLIFDAGLNASNVITPEVVPPPVFELTVWTLSNGDAPCSEVLISLQESNGVAPYVWVNPATGSTTTSSNIARAATTQQITITLEDSTTAQSSISNVVIPRLFTSAEISDISIVANAGAQDATVTIFMATDGSEFGGYEYSIDGVDYYISNVFTNIVDGDYTLYVREGLGCQVSQAFTVNVAQSIELPEPWFQISLANSIQMVQQKENKYQTTKNTLYRDRYVEGEYQPFYAQPYQWSDGFITTQFDTNYPARTAQLIDYCDGSIVDTLAITQQTNNIGITERMDAIAFNRGDNQTGLYFTTGNEYDPDTGAIIGTYELNGSLPDWGKVGNTVILTGAITGTYLIKQTIYDSTVQAYSLVIDLAWTSAFETLSVISTCTYDRLPYETYEFSVDPTNLTSIYYTQLILEDSSGTYDTIICDGALLDIKETHRKTFVIEYSHSRTAGINYDTGYVGIVRLKGMPPDQQPEDGSELSIYSDTNKEETLINYKDATIGTMFIPRITIDMWEKVKRITGHENIKINGEKWTATEGAQIESFRESAIKNVNVKFSRNNDDEYNNDDININGILGTIDQENDNPILQ